MLYGDGHIDKDEYFKRLEENEREIAYCEVKMIETGKIDVELSICSQVINIMSELWTARSSDNRMAVSKNVFEYVVVDLDIQRNLV